MTGFSAEQLALHIAEKFNSFEGEGEVHSVDLRSCCCKEQLVISDGHETWEVKSVNDSSIPSENPKWVWKASKLNV